MLTMIIETGMVLPTQMARVRSSSAIYFDDLFPDRFRRKEIFLYRATIM
jgi:hypothetical protein